MTALTNLDPALAERERLSGKGIGALAGSLVPFRGRFWFHSEGNDRGLLVDVTEPILPRLAKLPPSAFIDLDLSSEIDRRPPNAVIVPVTSEKFPEFPHPCTRVGAIWIQTRFIETVVSLPGYGEARWFAPNCVHDGDVHAVVDARVIAVIAGVSRVQHVAHNDPAVEV